MKRFLISSALLLIFSVDQSLAQTDITIRGAQAGFPVAIAQLCDAGEAADKAKEIAKTIAKDLEVSGLFKVLPSESYLETPGKCGDLDGVAFSDWSVIGAEALVKGEVTRKGSDISVRLVLFDVLQQRSVLGKVYDANHGDHVRVAHKFANEIVGFFSGEKGVFGSQIAFIAQVGRFKELFIMDSDGSNVRQLTQDKGLVVSPSWSPRGDKIVYTSYKTRQPELYIIGPDGGSATQVTDRKGLELGAKFTQDARSLVASASVAGLTNLVMFDLRGRLLRKVSNSSSIDVSPSLAPDGEQLAFCSNRAGGPQIYVSSIRGGEARRISFTPSDYCTSPSWSPKGDKIAFVCRASGNQIFMSSPNEREVLQLTFQGNNEDPNWSPDGRYIIFSSDFGRGGVRNIALLNVQTGEIKQLSFGKRNEVQPAWSPPLE